MKVIFYLAITSILFNSCSTSIEHSDIQNDTIKSSLQSDNQYKEEKFFVKTGYGDYVFQISGDFKNDSTNIEISHKGTDLEPGTFEVKIPGKFRGAFSSDVNENYKPELYFWSSSGENKYGKAFGYEFRSELITLTLPQLTEKYGIGYEGRDSFYINQDHFIRTFPVFEDGKNSSTVRRTLWYTLNEKGTLILIN